jgi:putative thioredoxin
VPFRQWQDLPERHQKISQSMVDFKNQVIGRSHTLPVLVDFWAFWCGPCRMLGQLAEEQKDQWELVKVNTEEQPDLAQEYGIMSIPNKL